MNRWRAACLLWGFLFSFWAVAQDAGIPPALRDWRDWVMHGQEMYTCAFPDEGDASSAEARICAWPGELAIDVDASGARFAQSWTLQAEAWVGLPGDARFWPQDVRADGQALAVLERDGVPVLRLKAGTHRIEGRLNWSKRPERVRVPESVALLALRVDGERLFPLQREGGQLWLGRAATAETEADALEVQVYRLLSDGIPQWLTTEIRLDVAGSGRELRLGPLLPPGFVPARVDSPLPLRLEADGRARVQLQPGSWKLRILARSLAPIETSGPVAIATDWPGEEIWAYQSNPQLRVSEASAARPVDPNQVEAPSDWRGFPTFVLAPGDLVTIAERSRGLRMTDANRVELDRQLWLDFDREGLHARDRLSGSMRAGWRLDLAEPFTLLRAEADGMPLLVTRSEGAGAAGIEVRNPAVNVMASASLPRAGSIPVSGWNLELQGARIGLNLPPAHLLIAAPGSDRADGAWLTRWKLVDVFLVCLSAVLLVRWLGFAFGAAGAALVVLAWFERESLVLLLALLAICCILVRNLGPGWLLRGARALRAGAALLLLFTAVPFVADQIRLALYPQLELQRGMGIDTLGGAVFDAMPQANQAPAPMAAAEAPMDYDQGAEELDRVQVTGSRMKKADVSRSQRLLQRYAASNVVQAGSAEPSWSWRSYRLYWSGPVAIDQTVQLVIAPPWLVRGLRVAMVGLLGLLLWQAWRRRTQTTAARVPATVAALVLAMVSLASAQAQDLPDAEMLEALRERLTEPPECAPDCARIEHARIEADAKTLDIRLRVHAAAEVAVALPSAQECMLVERIEIAERAVDGVHRDGSARAQVRVPIGVSSLRVSGRILNPERCAIMFPDSPGWVELAIEDWDAAGEHEGRLLADTLTLTRRREAEASEDGEVRAQELPAFVEVTRRLELDLDWSLSTTVRRIAPVEGSFSIELPLVPGEQVLTPGMEPRGGKLRVTLAANQSEAQWTSRLAVVPEFEWSAGPARDWVERWELQVSPVWSAHVEGPPELGGEAHDGFWTHVFKPLPDERIKVAITRPEPVSGRTLAIDSVNLRTRIAQRSREHTLNLSLRSTQGGQHVLRLGEGARVQQVTVDGRELNLEAKDGELALPVRPGSQSLMIRWQDDTAIGFAAGTAMLDLGAPASNLDLGLDLPAGRWLLAVSGPQIGPAVLYWGELVVMILAAFVLARIGLTPLRAQHWLLLGLGFSTVSWWAFALVAGWLLALGWRARRGAGLGMIAFNLTQLGLVILTLVALLSLLITLGFGLMAEPDMHLVGNHSYGGTLNWFADATEGAMPLAHAWSLPIWIYQAAILAWSLWLSFALVRWLRWGWNCLTQGGGWRRDPKPAPVAEKAPESAEVATDAPAPESQTTVPEERN